MSSSLAEKGILDADYYDDPYRKKLLAQCNPHHVQGGMEEALTGADIFIGVSGPGLVTKKMVEKMNKDAIVFAMANPVPEIYPDQAKAGGARVCGTGRSDFPNQVNNVSVFPGLFRGALDCLGPEDYRQYETGCCPRHCRCRPRPK